MVVAEAQDRRPESLASGLNSACRRCLAGLAHRLLEPLHLVLRRGHVDLEQADVLDRVGELPLEVHERPGLPPRRRRVDAEGVGQMAVSCESDTDTFGMSGFACRTNPPLSSLSENDPTKATTCRNRDSVAERLVVALNVLLMAARRIFRPFTPPSVSIPTGRRRRRPAPPRTAPHRAAHGRHVADGDASDSTAPAHDTLRASTYRPLGTGADGVVAACEVQAPAARERPHMPRPDQRPPPMCLLCHGAGRRALAHVGDAVHVEGDEHAFRPRP